MSLVLSKIIANQELMCYFETTLSIDQFIDLTKESDKIHQKEEE
jgi:hypothetical protein